MGGNKWGGCWKEEEKNLNIHLGGIKFVNVFYSFSQFESEKSPRDSDLNTYSSAGVLGGSESLGVGGI